MVILKLKETFLTASSHLNHGNACVARSVATLNSSTTWANSHSFSPTRSSSFLFNLFTKNGKFEISKFFDENFFWFIHKIFGRESESS